MRRETEEHKAAVRAAYQKKWRAPRLVWFNALKDRPCAACGGKFHPVCMDWHHRDESAKTFNIASGFRYAKPRILAEIAKCDLLCANCHRMESYGLNQLHAEQS